MLNSALPAIQGLLTVMLIQWPLLQTIAKRLRPKCLHIFLHHQTATQEEDPEYDIYVASIGFTPLRFYNS